MVRDTSSESMLPGQCRDISSLRRIPDHGPPEKWKVNGKSGDLTAVGACKCLPTYVELPSKHEHDDSIDRGVSPSSDVLRVGVTFANIICDFVVFQFLYTMHQTCSSGVHSVAVEVAWPRCG